MILAHSSVDWGTVPAWVGSLLSGVSVLLALFIILRDRRRAERDAASRVSYTAVETRRDSKAEWSPYQYRVSLRNASDQPIVGPLLRAIPRKGRRFVRELVLEGAYQTLMEARAAAFSGRPELKQSFYVDGTLCVKVSRSLTEMLDSLHEEQLVLPSDGIDLEVTLNLPSWWYRFDIIFRDGKNREWRRDLHTGKLHSFKRRRHSPRDYLLQRVDYYHESKKLGVRKFKL